MFFYSRNHTNVNGDETDCVCVSPVSSAPVLVQEEKVTVTAPLHVLILVSI